MKDFMTRKKYILSLLFIVVVVILSSAYISQLPHTARMHATISAPFYYDFLIMCVGLLRGIYLRFSNIKNIFFILLLSIPFINIIILIYLIFPKQKITAESVDNNNDFNSY